jgi:putative ABC transport system permease protein
MRRRHGLGFDKEDDFELNTQQMLMDLYQNITRVGFIAIVAIAAISLVVGGIGIMNIMLVSVAERTREIGIRKAVGASNQYILSQFLVESIILALIGGIIGIVFGTLLAALISTVSPLKAAVSFWMVLLGFGFSAAVGIFFGIYPARRAAGLNPIEALRYE